MDWLTAIFLFYSFIGLYFLFLYFLIYAPNRKNFLFYPKPKRNYSLSMVVPCYNEEENIGGTIKALLDSDYKGLKKIIVVDDCSTDNSYGIIKKYAEKYKKIKAVQTSKNTGKASGAKNFGAKFVDTELIGFTDADSYVKKNAIRRMIGFFNDENTAAVTSLILAKNRKNLLENLQAIEYKVTAFTRKMLGFVGAIYVTPGPLAVYRRRIFEKVGKFDESNMTEDIEITWNFASRGYGVKMSVPAKVYTVVPSKIRDWFRQRLRWNLGGIQTIRKYKNFFMKKGILGKFILPFFIFSWLVGIFGLFILSYRIIRALIVRYLSTTYSIGAQTAVLTMQDINLAPNILMFFGAILFTFSLVFTLIVLIHFREKDFKGHNIFYIMAYMFFYLLAYPVVLITSFYKFCRGIKKW